MQNKNLNIFRLFFAAMDLFALNTAHLILIVFVNRIAEQNDKYLVYFLVSNMIWVFSVYVNAVYVSEGYFNFEQFAKRSLKAFILFIVILLLFIFLYHFSFSRLFVIADVAGFGITIFITRIFFLLFVSYLKKGNKFQKKVIILGYNEFSKRLTEYIIKTNSNLILEGYFEDQMEVHEVSYFPILGNRKECLSYALSHDVTEIYSTISPERFPYVYDLAQQAEINMIRFKFVPDFNLFVNRNIHIDFLYNIPVLSLRAEPLEDITARIKKRLFDITFSFFIIILFLSWLIPIVGILIKLSSRGPVFFVQWRSGRNNEKFRCYKFRTLRVNKDANTKQVTFNDTRLTKIGRFLRKTNLDEMPQFFNVFMGNMTVVGPRPHMLKHTEDYSAILNEYMIRHYVKPGVTGWAQINGYRGEIRKKEQLRRRIEHDIWYMENWSLWLDIKIIFTTIYVTIKGDKNAY
jgi:putative colanic acid biosynthesis UDP-glucose lipid carrier transferase